MREFIWRQIAKLLSKPRIANWLIKRAKKTPYFHIRMPEDDSLYMERYWLFNPYDNKTGKRKRQWIPFSMRIHIIRMPDMDRHLHDHAWNFRTVVLDGWYREERPFDTWSDEDYPREVITRNTGDTAKLKHGRYHRISEVSPGGVTTLFITGRKRGSWGFLVDRQKVHWETYLANRSTDS